MNRTLVLTLLFFANIFGQIENAPDLTDKISPIGIAPYQHDGYGSADNQLAQPDDVELLADGSMIVSDVDNNRIQHFSNDGKLLNSITASDIGLAGIDIIPTGIAQDADGFIYVSLEGAGVVARFTPNLIFDQSIGKQCTVSAKKYYNCHHRNCLLKPQGLIVNSQGDVYVIDMAKSVFQVGEQRNIGFKKFKKIIKKNEVRYKYDQKFARTQEITKIMRKSEGMAIDESRGILFVAEEKPYQLQFGNSMKKRYIAAFDLKSGKYLDKLYGVIFEQGNIVDGYFFDSVEGLAVMGEHLFAVDEKAGKIYIFEIDNGKCLGSIGKRATYYCDDESDCVIRCINYNEQSIIAGSAFPHLNNDWKKNELASPDGISVITLEDGLKHLAVVDQWNSRILLYDLDKILKLF